MSESMAPAALAALLRDLYVGRRTGRLVFAGEPRRTALLWKGRVVHASSSSNAEHLGELLVARGRLAAETLAQATETVVREKKRLGETLIAMGVLDRDGLEEAVADHVRDLFVRAVSEPELSVTFEELDPERPMEADVSSKIATGDLILEAVTRVPSEALDGALGSLDRRLVLSNDPLLRFQRISLGPVDGYVLSRVDGTLSATELFQMIPVEPEEARRSLLRLLSAGIVEFAEDEEPAERAATTATTQTEAAPPAHPAAKPAPPPPAAAPAAAAPLPARRPSPPEPPAAPSRPAPPPTAASAHTEAPRKVGIGAQRRAIEEAFAAISGQNHFEVLALTRQATDADVKKAYFRLARDFHPDRFADPRLADLRPQAEAIFLRVGEAYEVLRDPALRGRYEADLSARAPRAPSAGPAEAPASTDTPPSPSGENPELLAQQVEGAIRKAKVLLKKEQYWDVIQLVEPQLEYAQGVWLNHARLLLAQCYLQNPNWLRRGEEQLLALVEADPKHVHAHFLLGRFYAERGLKSRAASLLQRCLELDPDNAEAAKLYESVRVVEPEPEAPQGGLLKKLFGR